MNIFKKYFLIVEQFLLCWVFWRKNLGKKMNLPVLFKMSESLGRMPKYVPLGIRPAWYPAPIEIDPLKIPRHFGSDGEKQVEIMGKLNDFAQNYFDGVTDLSKVKNPQDGGLFWDRFLNRRAGDTPIGICEYFTWMNFKCLSNSWRLFGCDEDFQIYQKWLRPFVDYVRDYEPAQLNNHVSWKAVFLASSGLVLRDEDLLKEAYFLYNIALNAIDDDGSMPLELIRGDKAATYTLMNLEALIHLENIFYGRKIHFSPMDNALNNFKDCIEKHDEWQKKYNLPTQLHPNDLTQWNWIFMFRDPSTDFDICQNSYISHFTKAWHVR